VGTLMASPSRTLKLSLLADTSKFESGLAGAERQAEGFGSKLAKFGKAAALAMVAVGAAALAVGKKLVEAGERAATSNARIENIAESMGLFGEAAGEVSQRLIEQAEATARLTGVDQNSIKATQAKLLTFKNLAATADTAGGAFDRANQAALDLAAAGFGTAEGNAVQLGKALEDPVKGLAALTRSGVTFTEEEKKKIATLVESGQVLEAQEMILAAVETQVGGTAEATANGSDRMKVAFSLLQEQLGQKLLPIFEKVVAFVLDKLLPTFDEWVVKYGPKVREVAEKVGAAFVKFSDFVRDRVLPVVMSMWAFFRDVLIPGFMSFVMPVINAVRDAFKRVSDQLGGGNSDGLITFLGYLWNIAKTVVTFFNEKVAPVMGKVVAGAFEVVTDIVVGFISTLQTMYDWIVSAIAKIQELISLVANSAIGQAVGSVVGALTGRASGGPVTARTPYIVGERGPELFVPASTGSIVPNHALGQGNITINVTGTMLDPEGVARAVERAMRDSRLRTGVAA
jgi:phage-related protein